jgi:hypothetical protein
MAQNNGWIAVDLDGTCAKYDGWKGPTHVGEPVPSMVARMKQWMDEGIEVRIFTARVYPINQCINPDTILTVTESEDERMNTAIAAVKAIQQWCKLHLGKVIPITNVKDYSMTTLFDDRAIQVVMNTGALVGGVPKKGH